MKLRSLLLAASLVFVAFGFVSDSTPAQIEEITNVYASADYDVVFQSVPQFDANYIEYNSQEAAAMQYTIESVPVIASVANDLRESECWVSEKVPIYETNKG